MARNINDLVHDLFYGRTQYAYHSDPHDDKLKEEYTYMEIPINKSEFEIPLFALDSFNSIYSKENNTTIEAIVAFLKTVHKTPGYKTLNRNMMDVLLESLDQTLIKVSVDYNGSERPYFVTKGAVFDSHFKPLLLCSWNISRGKACNGYATCLVEYPIIRISPDCYLHQNDNMQKFICKRFINASLSTCLNLQNCTINTSLNARDRTAFKTPKVEIGEFPFTIKIVSTPSISTTNETLMNILKEHLDEIYV